MSLWSEMSYNRPSYSLREQMEIEVYDTEYSTGDEDCQELQACIDKIGLGAMWCEFNQADFSIFREYGFIL